VTFRGIVTPAAEADLRRTYHYIRKRGAAEAAKAWLSGIRSRIKSLKHHPQRTPLAPETASFEEPIHELLYGSGNRGTYRILFTIMSQTVYVLSVRHGSMLPMEP